MKKNLYNLDLHESILIPTKGVLEKTLAVIRVPGGWLYQGLTGNSISFVPYDNEFAKKINP